MCTGAQILATRVILVLQIFLYKVHASDYKAFFFVVIKDNRKGTAFRKFAVLFCCFMRAALQVVTYLYMPFVI